MGVLNIEALDDELVFDASTSFTGGQVSNDRPSALQPNQLAKMVNADIALTGQLITRRGTAGVGGAIGAGTYIQGLFHFNTPSIDRFIAVNGTRPYYWDGATWTATSGWVSASSLAPVVMVQGINLIYLTDGVGDIQSYNGTTFTSLGHVANNQPPAAPKCLAWHTSRLIAAGMLAEPDAIYYSDFLDGATWDKTTQQIRVGGGDSDRIVGVIPWTNHFVIVLKTRSVWLVNCNPQADVADFEITRVHGLIGCIAPLTAVQVGSDVFFLSDSGVRSLQRTIASEQQTEVGEALSFPVQDIIERINPAAVGTACASYWNHRYIIFLPLDTSSFPNYALVYNNLTKSWSGTWTGLSATALAARGVSGAATRLAFGLANGRVVDWLDYIQLEDETEETFEDSGVDIATEILTRAFTFSEAVCPKTGVNAEMEFNRSRATVTAEAVLDDKVPVQLEPARNPFVSGHIGLTLPHTLPATFPKDGLNRFRFDLQEHGQFRELQVRLKSPAKKLALQNIVASAFVDTVELS